MDLRTLYLQRSLSINGRSALAGRRLYDRFRAISKDCILGHFVVQAEESPKYKDPRYLADVISADLVRRLSPNVVYLEGGLLVDESQWRLPRAVAEELLSRGAVIIVADVDANAAEHHKEAYEKATKFFRAAIDYRDDQHPVYGADQTSFWHSHRQIVCHPDDMMISPWMRPIYEGVSEILVGIPIRLFGENLVASGNASTTGALHNDTWVDRVDACPFAAAARILLGYVVLIAARVSGDTWLERCPDNTTWLTNVARFLVEDAEQDAQRIASDLRSPYVLFLSHRSSDQVVVSEVAQQIRRRGIGIWLDRERLIPSDSLSGGIDSALGSMTHYVLLWSKTCPESHWVSHEWQVAMTMHVDRGVPILIVRLDSTPVPPTLSDLVRIEAESMTPPAMGDAIAGAVRRLAERAQRK